MTRDIITNKWFIGAIALLIIFAGACYLWYQHDTAPYRQEAAESAKLLRQQEAAKKVDTVNEAVQAAEKAPAESNTLTTEKPINAITAEVENNTEVEKQTNTPAGTAQAEDVPVSPFGFGPYPDVPEGMLDSVGNVYRPIWDRPKFPNIMLPERAELMSRVAIKAWQEGLHRNWIGIGGANGKIYFNYPNTIYVWYGEREEVDGTITRYFTRVKGKILSPEQMRLGIAPSGMRVLDGETEGIEPYAYLGISKTKN